MIHAFPKTHMLAVGTVSALLILVLAFSPSTKVNATRTTIPLTLEEPTLDLLTSIRASEQDSQKTANSTATKTNRDLEEKQNWISFEIREGDTLSTLFKKAGLNDRVMYQVIGSKKQNKDLSRIFPGETISFLLQPEKTDADIANQDSVLKSIKLERNPLETYRVERSENGDFVSKTVTRSPEIHIAYGEGTIDSSLFLAGQKAGLSQAQIMELANIFGWDIDFVLDIRSGDRFHLIYEELYLDGEKLKNGRILAASFTNQNRTLEAVLYEEPNGNSNYYTPEGNSMRKAFIRTPVDFARVSSHFNLKRKHPILHKIRAHKGTDYAASRGTPIKAAGDGKIIHAGRKGGYGKTVIIQHGQKITTLYAHMHKYARGIRNGARVKQGQVIGYVGSSGLASGPHLHYEFRVNGVHKNPVRVKLPHAQPIPKNQLASFKSQTGVFMAQLSTFRESYQLAVNE